MPVKIELGGSGLRAYTTLENDISNDKVDISKNEDLAGQRATQMTPHNPEFVEKKSIRAMSSGQPIDPELLSENWIG